MGRLQFLQEVLGLEISSTEALSNVALPELEARFRELQTAYNARFKR
jgi:hypothetical protein